MVRVRKGPTGRRRHKKVLKAARGFVGGQSKLIRTAKERVDRALQYAYRDRKVLKRDMRRLWQIRISAAVAPFALSYSRFIHGLKKAGVDLDRKVLAEIAIRDPEAFAAVATVAKEG